MNLTLDIIPNMFELAGVGEKNKILIEKYSERHIYTYTCTHVDRRAAQSRNHTLPVVI